jgi:hypothetical protein
LLAIDWQRHGVMHKDCNDTRRVQLITPREASAHSRTKSPGSTCTVRGSRSKRNLICISASWDESRSTVMRCGTSPSRPNAHEARFGCRLVISGFVPGCSIWH